MGKKVYNNRIRVMLADKMNTKTHLVEQLGVKNDNKPMLYQYYTTKCPTTNRDFTSTVM